MHIPLLTPLWNRSKATAARYERMAEAEATATAEQTGMRAMWDGFIREAAVYASDTRDRWDTVGTRDFWMPGDDGQPDVLQTCRKLYWTSPLAHGVIELLVRTTFGQGFRVRPADDTVAERWKEFAEANLWGRRELEFGRRAFRDGEVFVRRFAADRWPPKVRFIEPDMIVADESGRYSHGIEFDPKDAETPVTYFKRNRQTGGTEPIPAAEVQHVKTLVDLATPRGVPILFPGREYFRYIDRTAWAMAQKAYIAACHVMVQRLKGASPAQVASWKAAREHDSEIKREDTYGTRRVRPGIMAYANESVEYEWQNPQIGADEQVTIAREHGLALGAMLGLTEYQLRGDASNANMASLQVAETGARDTILFWQEFFKDEFLVLWRWLMSEAQRVGAIPAGADTTVSIEYPELTRADIGAYVRALNTMFVDGIMSAQTYAAKMNLDYDEEQERNEEHEARAMAVDPQHAARPADTEPDEAKAQGDE